MNIVIPLYISNLSDNIRTDRYIKMLFGCLNSYYYNGNSYNISVATNNEYVKDHVYKFNNSNDYNDVGLIFVDDNFFTSFIDNSSHTYNLNVIQSIIKLSAIKSLLLNHFDEFVLMDLDTIFTSNIVFDGLSEDKSIRFYRNLEIYSKYNYRVSHMINDKPDLNEYFQNLDEIWINSGIVVVNKSFLSYLDKYRYVYDNPRNLKVSDELIFNILYHNNRDIFEISDLPYNITSHVRTEYSIIHFFSIKPYHIYIDKNKNLNMRLNTDDIFDHIDREYFDLLTFEMSKYYSKDTIYNCLLWWYYYGDAVGKMDDPFKDFQLFDANYIKVMIDKLF